MLEECRPERGALTDDGDRGRARPCVVVGPFRRARLRPPGDGWGPSFKGPTIPREPPPAAQAPSLAWFRYRSLKLASIR